MTDKQIDINNQVEVGLNIAKELLELHKMFKDEVEKSPHFIQTNFIKNKLFYFYQRADWLNVCFNLLDKERNQLKAKEQECEELKKDLHKNFKEKDTLHLIIDRLLEASGYDTNTASAEDFEDVYEHMRYEQEQLDQLKAENDQLKRQHQGDKGLITSTGKQNYQLLQEYDRLKTALTEIKEIAEKLKKFYEELGKCEGLTVVRLKQILQKISEVEND